MTAAMRPPAPDEQLGWLVDRAQISDLLYRFARALDEKDFEGYAGLYAEDGELVLPWGGHRGRAGLAEHVRGDLGGFGATHHISSNHLIEVDGDSAASRSYLQAVHVLDAADRRTHWDVGGWYDCSYRRTAEGWRFTRVAITDVWHGGVERD